MIVHVEAIYESGMLKLKEALPLPEHTTVTALVKSPLGTAEEADAWKFIQEGLRTYAIEGQIRDWGEATSHNIVDKRFLEVWESPDDIHLDDTIGLASKKRTQKLCHFLVSCFGFRSQWAKDSRGNCGGVGGCKTL